MRVVAIPSILVFLLLLAGCAKAPLRERLDQESREIRCRIFFTTFDNAVESAGVRDAGSSTIDAFPYLRVDRFLASFADEQLSGAAFKHWVEWLRRLDAEARTIEWANLSEDQRKIVSNALPTGEELETYVANCGKRIVAVDLTSVSRKQRLMLNAKRPDAYITWQRILGIYGLTRYAARSGVDDLHEELRASFRRNLSDLPVAGHLIRYRPNIAKPLTHLQVAEMLQSKSNNPLRIPEPTGVAMKRLFDTFSPVWEIDTKSSADRIGKPALNENGNVLVDTLTPVVYQLMSHTRYRGRVLLQLNYIVWFPARPKDRVFDLFGGRLDGLIWRVTLSTDGQPLAYDSIHPCGCYYLVFPSQNVRVRQPGNASEPVLTPRSMPDIEDGQRILIRVAAKTHFIQQIGTTTRAFRALVYEHKPYAELRSLRGPADKRRSLFDQTGLVPESARLERYLLWPFGVPNAGAMRQWGTHAIAFVGRRHFDDADLMEVLLEPKH